MEKEILIIGAGPAGLSCALGLAEGGKKLTIIEKEKEIGGLCKTLEFKEGDLTFRTDIGPHRFFSKNQELYFMAKRLLGEDWILVNRQTRQFINGKFYDYPINAKQALKNVGFFNAVVMGSSYMKGVTSFKLFRKPIRNFEDYIISNFGKELGDFSMLNYTEKIWGIPCSQIHPDWAKQRIKGLNFISTLKGMFIKGKDSPKTLVDAFYYPRRGTGTLYSAMQDKISSLKGKFILESHPTQIIHDGKKITNVKILENNTIKDIKPEILVSGMPLTELVSILKPQPPKKVLDATKKLKWRDQIYLFITLDKERVTPDNWIYFPNLEIPFGRIAEMKNFSQDMGPKGKTSLFIEFFATKGDKLWNMSDEELFKTTLGYLTKFKLIDEKDVRKYYVMKRSYVYPVYDLEYKDNIKIIKQYLDKIKNLRYIGRPGRFNYTNQDHSLEMGIATAKSILSGKPVNLDKIGSEDEYFEEGSLNENE